MNDYRALPTVIENAQTVIQDGDQTVVFVRMNGQIYHAVIKTTASGLRDYLTSFRFTDIADVNRLKKKGKVLKDAM